MPSAIYHAPGQPPVELQIISKDTNGLHLATNADGTGTVIKSVPLKPLEKHHAHCVVKGGDKALATIKDDSEPAAAENGKGSESEKK